MALQLRMEHPEPVDDAGPVTRADVEKWWTDALDGRCSWADVSVWAEDRLTGSEDLVLREGLLQLQSANLRGLPLSELTDVMTANLAVWHSMLVTYDAGPPGFERAYLRRVLASHAQNRGVDAARLFGQKMVARGELTDLDVLDAIGTVVDL